ncbi:hypothetical protein L1987_33255 [Smallanthus sonchifolius]|uniref:Uncharacterized protein n=1 Tax=Smallanthus sonchifolius TaxID=185202 RepID=A0ACB9HQL1_9ASTR|nr:hypothetical protein L1987_33255 [Smallanthus sonchifolius]
MGPSSSSSSSAAAAHYSGASGSLIEPTVAQLVCIHGSGTGARVAETNHGSGIGIRICVDLQVLMMRKITSYSMIQF